MDVARPYAAVVPSLDGDVLVALSGTTRPLTGAQVARLVRRGAPRGVLKALDRLVEQGIVRREVAGRSYMHTLNRDHIAAPLVEGLAGLRGELLGRLRHELASWRPAPLHASLFGSAARGDGDTQSDIDVFIVRPATVDEEDAAWRDQLERLATRVGSWTGNAASILELAETDLQAPLPPIAGDLRADAIDLAGVRIRALLDGWR